MTERDPRPLTRRRLLGGAVTAPLAAPLVLTGCGAGPRPGDGPTVAALAYANSLTARPLPSERLPTILPAVRMNHAFFRAVRDLEIPDLVEPAVVFVARGRADEPAAEEDAL